jgi:hypothetical protein
MDRIATFIQENLNGYNLPADDLVEIRGILLRRFGAKFSDGLSPEGRIAMEQAAKREVESAACLHRIKGESNGPNQDAKATGDTTKSLMELNSFTDTNNKDSPLMYTYNNDESNNTITLARKDSDGIV